MRVFSYDPGSTNIGFSVIDSEDMVLMDYGLVVGLPKDEVFNTEMDLKIKFLWEWLQDKFSEHDVSHVAWEIVPAAGGVGHHAKTIALATVLKVVACSQGLPYTAHAFRGWMKKLLPDVKKPEKSDTKEYVQGRFSEEEFPSKLLPDAYDAIGLGLVATRENKWKSWSS